MRHPLFLPLLLLCTTATAQVQLRAYHHLLTSAVPNLDRCTPLANGDIAYHDQVQPGLVRLAPDGNVVWHREFDGGPGIGDVLELPGGALVALLHMPVVPGDITQSYPVLVGMNGDGAVLWSKRWTGALGFAMTVQAHLAHRQGGGFLMVHKPLTMGGGNETLHAFTGEGALEWARHYAEPGGLPSRMELLPDGGYHGSNELFITRYDADGTLLWSVGPMLIGGSFAAIRDVKRLPTGAIAFAFATNTVGGGGGPYSKPGIGILTAPDEVPTTAIFNVPAANNNDPVHLNLEMAITDAHILMVAPNGTSGGVQPGYVLRTDHALTEGQANVVDLGTGGYVRTLRGMADGGAAITGKLVSTGIGQKLVGRIAPTAQLGGCFAPTAVPLQPITSSSSMGLNVTITEHAPVWLPFAVETMDRPLTMQAWCLYTGIADGSAHAEAPSVHPNPAQGHFMVEWPAASASRMRMIDAEGRVCLERTMTATRAQVDVTGIAPGTYLVQFTALDGSRSAAARMVVMP